MIYPHNFIQTVFVDFPSKITFECQAIILSSLDHYPLVSHRKMADISLILDGFHVGIEKHIWYPTRFGSAVTSYFFPCLRL